MDSSGQMISLEKSQVFFSKAVEERQANNLSEVLDIPITTDLGKYLGMPIINGRMTKETYRFIVDKVNARLSGWRSKYLFLAGRVTLTQSVLSSLPYYSIQSALLPRATCNEIEKKCHGFIWVSTDEAKKIHLVKWNMVSKHKNHGGLGIRSMRQSNMALVTKLGWRVMNEDSNLWSRVLRHKYCTGRNDIDVFRPSREMSNVWKGIVHGAPTLRKGGWVSVGNGNRTLFWYHNWVEDRPFKALATNPIEKSSQNNTIVEYWGNNGWRWGLFSDLLLEESLLKIININVVQENTAEDKLFWNGSS